MSIKRKDTPEARAYWRFVEETARRWRENAPGWALCSCGHPYDRHVTRYACVLKPEAPHGE